MYGFESVEKHKTRMGGVALFIGENITYFGRNDLAPFDEDIESVIEIGTDRLNFRRDITQVSNIGTCYRYLSFNEKRSVAFVRIAQENDFCKLFGSS